MSDDRQRQRQNRERERRVDSHSSSESDDSTSISNADSGGTEQSQPSGSSRGGSFAKPLIAIAAAAAVAVGAFFLTGSGGGVDSISDSDNAARIAQYQTLTAGPGMPLSMIDAEDVEQAIADMPASVSEETREEIRTAVNQGRIQLAWLTLWDTHAEDGDILRFESSTSIPIEVMALNAKTTVAIPYPADGQVLVTGVVDGGGGITIGLESGATQILWPTMAPGDTLNLPVTPSP